MFMKFVCGCIGIQIEPASLDPKGARAKALVFHPCDGRDEGLVCLKRTVQVSHSLREEHSIPLDEEWLERFIQDINQQLADGQRLREVRQLLGCVPCQNSVPDASEQDFVPPEKIFLHR